MRKSYGIRCCQRGFTFNDQILELHSHNTQLCQFYQVNPLSYFSFTLCNLLLTNRKVLRIIITFYKITKIVRALWLAERSVYMRICKHGCGVKMYWFSRANNASTDMKKFSSSTLDKFTLFTHSFVGWNLENRYKEGVSIFFRVSWHFRVKNPYFGNHLFAKQEHAQDTRGVGRILDSYAKPSTSSRVCITVSNSPKPSRVYIRLCKHRKRFLLLNCFSIIWLPWRRVWPSG